MYMITVHDMPLLLTALNLLLWMHLPNLRGINLIIGMTNLCLVHLELADILEKEVLDIQTIEIITMFEKA